MAADILARFDRELARESFFDDPYVTYRCRRREEPVYWSGQLEYLAACSVRRPCRVSPRQRTGPTRDSNPILIAEHTIRSSSAGSDSVTFYQSFAFPSVCSTTAEGG
jgi:hypothetical protein